jgi:hypothetical protein
MTIESRAGPAAPPAAADGGRDLGFLECTLSAQPRRCCAVSFGTNQGKPMTRSYGLLHVNRNVRGLARSVRGYTEALGFTVVSEAEETVDCGAGPTLRCQMILTLPMEGPCRVRACPCAEQGPGADCQKRPLRSRFRQQLRPGVRHPAPVHF